MSQKRRLEDQDPDYPDDSPCDSKQQRLNIKKTRIDTCERIRRVVRTHFGSELRRRESQIFECQQRLQQATQALHLLRYLVVTSYYTSSQAPEKQNKLHPAVKKLVGNQKNLEKTIKLDIPNPKSVPTICRSEKKSCAAVESSKQPRYIAPIEKAGSSIFQSPPRAANLRVKTRLVIGNISKWIHEDMREDAATHKWMLYVRGSRDCPNISHIVERVRFFLHASYQPNDVIEVTESPFHLSRRGWGEFPVRVQIHFQHCQNRPLDVIHQLRLDHTYTGLQTLGAETVVDAWLFTPSESCDSSKHDELGSNSIEESNVNCDDQIEAKFSSTVFSPKNLLEDFTATTKFGENLTLNHCPEDSVKKQNSISLDLLLSNSLSMQNVSQVPIPSSINQNFPERTTGSLTSSGLKNTSNEKRSIFKLFPVKSRTPQQNNSFMNGKVINNEPNKVLNFEKSIQLKHHDYAKPLVQTSKLSIMSNPIYSESSNKDKIHPINSVKSGLISKNVTSVMPAFNSIDVEPSIVTARSHHDSRLVMMKSTPVILKTTDAKPLLIKPTSVYSVLKTSSNNAPFQSKPLLFNSPILKPLKQIIYISQDRRIIKSEDVCAIKQSWQEEEDIKLNFYKTQLRDLESRRVDNEEVAVLWLMRSLPLVVKDADASYKQIHPYVVSSAQQFLSYPLGKRRAIEAMRARQIVKLMMSQGFPQTSIWKIAKVSEMYGFTPPVSPTESADEEKQMCWLQPIKPTYSEPSEFILSWLTIAATDFQRSHEKTQVDVESLDEIKPAVALENKSESVTVKEVVSPEVAGIKHIASQVDVTLQPEEVSPGVALCASQIALLEAAKCLAEDLVRRAFSASKKRVNRFPPSIELADVQTALCGREEFDVFSNWGLGVDFD